MIDIFDTDEKPQPCLYIADIKIVVSYPSRKGSKKMELVTLDLDNYPIVLNGKDFPTSRYREKFLHRIHERYIDRNNYDLCKFKVTEIKNIKFSSKLAYRFNYETD
jgi:hypothetical protein